MRTEITRELDHPGESSYTVSSNQPIKQQSIRIHREGSPQFFQTFRQAYVIVYELFSHPVPQIDSSVSINSDILFKPPRFTVSPNNHKQPLTIIPHP